ncbi:5195_t:CDS:2 [Entrophospora sp. SA101]|nr:5195_t:CDS:2 [Entrophospora sp. SA101]
MKKDSYYNTQELIFSPTIYSYRLEVCQQPIRARMCGFGDKDRRPIDPPPVVSSIDHSMMVVHAGLWNEDKTEERSLVINPSTIPAQSSNGPSSTVLSLHAPARTRNLMGHYTSSAYVLYNHLGESGIYFIFQDISVRTEGTFSLRFSFCDLKELLIRSSLNGYPNSRGSVGAEVFSESFRVYSAKKFPGMTESTSLSKAFARQGIKIPIRKETRYRKSNNNNNVEHENNVEGKVKESTSLAASSSSSSSSKATLKPIQKLSGQSTVTTSHHHLNNTDNRKDSINSLMEEDDDDDEGVSEDTNNNYENSTQMEEDHNKGKLAETLA